MLPQLRLSLFSIQLVSNISYSKMKRYGANINSSSPRHNFTVSKPDPLERHHLAPSFALGLAAPKLAAKKSVNALTRDKALCLSG